jgi:S-adenosylmethionine:tRNA ribosyltransferase-isomerase
MTELDHYDFELPRELIAQQPLPHRADARLMLVDRRRDAISHWHVRDLPTLLRRGDLLVMNNTRVVRARLVGTRERTGGKWSGLFLQVDEQGTWQILSRTRGKLEPGELIALHAPGNGGRHHLRLLAKLEEGAWAARPEPAGEVWEILERVGRVPLPPYIRGGEMTDDDLARYQTVYAKQPGSVAAPTAGLHFTAELLDRLRGVGIEQQQVTLHVGLGTFRPVAVERLDQHVMHSEWCAVEETCVAACRSANEQGGRVVAVGTTSLRTLETAARSGTLLPFRGWTDLFIRPGFQFHAAQALLTNFHLPRSTLLVLVRTFGGDALLRRAYEAAVAERYRFFSYGDAMLIV